MHSNEELAQMPLSFFENSDLPCFDKEIINDIKLLAMNEVSLVFVEPNELPEINIL